MKHLDTSVKRLRRTDTENTSGSRIDISQVDSDTSGSLHLTSSLLLGETGNTNSNAKTSKRKDTAIIESTVEDEDEKDEESKAGADLPPPVLTKLARSKSRFDSIVKRISREDIRLVYTMERILGSGNFGTARLAHKTGHVEKKFAIKSIARKKVEADLNLLEAELDILLAVDHPHICTFYEAYLDHKYVHLVMEYCSGGELYTYLEQVG